MAGVFKWVWPGQIMQGVLDGQLLKLQQGFVGELVWGE